MEEAFVSPPLLNILCMCLGAAIFFSPHVWLYRVLKHPEGENGSLQYNSNGDIDPYTDSRVVKKMRHNETNFPYGYMVPDDKWDNFWRDGKNATLGWDQSLTGSGSGAKTMGEELAHSQAFAQCQVEKVFRNVCLRDVADSIDRAQVSTMVSSFEANNYNIKQVFAESAAYCKGD